MQNSKVIWSFWGQGRDCAPYIAEQCMRSWERRNPDWTLRVLDLKTLRRYVNIERFVDLERQSMQFASFSDLLRILLLREYGGVWVDASVFCRVPLDTWLPDVMQEGFFAFDKPSKSRMVASWFLASEPNNPLVEQWCNSALDYWSGRTAADDYFWFHKCFGSRYLAEQTFRDAWDAVPKVSALPPYWYQQSPEGTAHLYLPAENQNVPPPAQAPVFKLSLRNIVSEKLSPDSRIYTLLQSSDIKDSSPAPCAGADAGSKDTTDKAPGSSHFAALKTSTTNLGDCVQTLGALNLLERFGITPDIMIDRDHEIGSAPQIAQFEQPVPTLINGWFKRNGQEWPPHPNLDPVFMGFHMRPQKCKELLLAPSIAYLKTHGPIGCRDTFTQTLLEEHGVEAWTSHCLSLLLPRRQQRPEHQTETFVVSRDEKILAHLPDHLRPLQFICHYSSNSSFEPNIDYMKTLLALYRDKAARVVTTLLHCALPCIAMGIPVIMIYPEAEAKQRKSDQERLSSLSTLLPIYTHTDLEDVDWFPSPVNVSGIKLDLIDRFETLSRHWKTAPVQPTGPIADARTLPPVSGIGDQDLLKPDALHPDHFSKDTDVTDIHRLIDANRIKWSKPESYNPNWKKRAAKASALIAPGSKVFEIGAGLGQFKDMVAAKCRYTGTDLTPVRDDIQPLNIEHDPLPKGDFDYAVALGVFEYLQHPDRVAKKLLGIPRFITSYCAVNPDRPKAQLIGARQSMGWVNEMSDTEFCALFNQVGWSLKTKIPLNTTAEMQQSLYEFTSS